jgi:hypothetical protein
LNKYFSENKLLHTLEGNSSGFALTKETPQFVKIMGRDRQNRNPVSRGIKLLVEKEKKKKHNFKSETRPWSLVFLVCAITKTTSVV